MPENSHNSKTTLITGASAGIGFSLAKIFARDGYSLVLIARNKDKLQQLAQEVKVPTTIIAKDLSIPSSPQEIFLELQSKKIHVDILINNAGIGSYGPFAQTSLDEELRLLQVNIVALTQLTKLFLPAMIENKYGKIMNVSSTAAFQPGPLMAVYYASKAYVQSLSEALSNETTGTGVTVTALCPGPTRTEFQSRAHMEESKLFAGKIMTSDEVAEIGYKGLMAGKRVVITGFSNKLLSLIAKLSPNSIVMQSVRKMQEKRKKD
jgi:short-subunit dehydrogenase